MALTEPVLVVAIAVMPNRHEELGISGNPKSAQSVVNFPKRFEDISFDNPLEVVRFMGAEIRSSKATYKEIALKIGMSPQTVARIASEETKDPRTNTIIRIAVFFGFKLVLRR